MLSAWGQAAAPAATPAPAPTTRPIPAVEHVFIISIDALRPDKALQANMPTLRAMLKEGTYTFWARTTDLAITLPSHASMVTGVTPQKHGITWNDDSRPGVYPNQPTVMAMATRAGYVTAMAAGKSKFASLNPPGTITHVWVPSGTNAKDNNNSVIEQAAKMIEADKPALMLIHFPDTDTVGHAKGWASPEYLAAVDKADTGLAAILAALDRAKIRGSSIVIVTADHGGQGKTHGAGDERSLNIPWVITGPGVRHGYDLTDIVPLVVHTEDTAATACWLLGLPLPDYFDGKVLADAFVKQ
ncbi:MAG: alkaline phosphatase family protein [Verrucomicrobiota bacterium]